MNKLTKEQAEWLIDKIEHDFGGWNGLPIEQFMPDLKRCINQCIEKEFPAYDLNLDNGAMVYIQPVNFGHLNQEQCAIDVEVEDYLNFEQFKQFAEGVNKIVEWIDEQ